MRVLVDIEAVELAALDRLAKREKRSRASVIREAVADHLRAKGGETRDEAFGLWDGMAGDGLTYQQKIRGEW